MSSLFRDRIRVNLLFEPRDLWVGAFWDHKVDLIGRRAIVVYLCVVPMLPS